MLANTVSMIGKIKIYLPSAVLSFGWSTFDLSARRLGLSFVCLNESDSLSFPRGFSAV